MSQLLKNINDDAANLSKMELVNQLASVLDKHREVSIQEATYRMMGFPMVKSSTVVKYVTTCHPNFKDGLLKSNIEDIDDKNESLFHDSPSTYYENRPINKPSYEKHQLDKTDSENDDNVKNDIRRPEQDPLNQTWAKRRKKQTRHSNLDRTWHPNVTSLTDSEDCVSDEDEINVQMDTTSQENIDQTWRPDLDSDNSGDECFNAEDQENENNFNDDEKKPNYWDNLTFTEFMA